MDFDQEQQLLKNIKRGSVHAFERLFDQYWEYLHNIAYNRIQSAHLADDVVQQVFTDFWKNRQSITIESSLRSYLYQAVKHKVYKHIRHQSVRRKEQYIRRIQEQYYRSNAESDPEQATEYNELHTLYSNAVNDLPAKSRKIFMLSREKDYTHKQIAHQLNCSQKTVEYHIGKVLGLLRLKLSEYII